MDRRIIAQGSVYIEDDEVFQNEHRDVPVFVEAIVGRNAPASLLTFSECCGGEVRVEVALVAQALENGDVRVTGTAKLFEGTSCNTTDLDDEEGVDVVVPANRFLQFHRRLLSEGAGGGDFSDIRLNFANFPA